MADQEFTCSRCGSAFTVRPEILARYPGWKPSTCLACRDAAAGKGAAKQNAARKGAGKGKAGKGKAGKGAASGPPPAPEAVLARYTAGPFDGVFTDGACSGNPGPGGWSAVWVKGDELVEERHGASPRTTNNRMELSALIAAYEMLPEAAAETIWSDSNLCVRTLNEWAAGWERRGWRRKTGPVENLDLVRRAYELARAHPRVRLRWIKAHNGSRWNEYADALANAYRRPEGGG